MAEIYDYNADTQPGDMNYDQAEQAAETMTTTNGAETMDPTVALINALSCIRDGHADDAAENLRNLAEWIGGGGFLPDLTAPGVALQLTPR